MEDRHQPCPTLDEVVAKRLRRAVCKTVRDDRDGVAQKPGSGEIDCAWSSGCPAAVSATGALITIASSSEVGGGSVFTSTSECPRGMRTRTDTLVRPSSVKGRSVLSSASRSTAFRPCGGTASKASRTTSGLWAVNSSAPTPDGESKG